MTAQILPKPGELDPAVAGSARLWTGRALSGIVFLFLALVATPKLLEVPSMVQNMRQVGLPVGAIMPIGLAELACAILFLLPRTAVLGTILMTGYLGGAVCANVFARLPILLALSPTLVAVAAWSALWLRHPGLPARLLPRISWRQPV